MGRAEGLPCATEVQSLFVSRDGTLWANSCAKLFRFDGQRFQEAVGIDGMFSRAQSMADGLHGHLVVATSSGLMELAPNGAGGFLAARPYPAMAGKRARGVFRHGSDLWFGCEDRLCVERNGQVLEFGVEQGLPSDSWDAIGVTPEGTVWVRSPSKLYRKASASARFSPETAHIAPSMYWGALSLGPDGSLLVPTDEGLAIRQGGNWSIIDESRGLRSSMASAVLRDRDGSLWIGLIGAGVARCLGYGDWESWTSAEGLASNLVWNILRDRKGALWVATNKGLTRLGGQPPARTWTRRDGLAGDNVRWLGETPDGSIWAIANPGGLTRIDPASGKLRPVGRADGLETGTLYRGLVDHLGRLWIATNSGVYRCEAPAASSGFVKVSPTGPLDKGAWAVSEDKRGIIWVISPDGLWRHTDSQWRLYRKADGLLGGNPYIIAVAADNSLWLRHRFDAGVERVEFQGEHLVRSTAIVSADSTVVDVTAFHGFDSLGGFWRGTANGVFVLRNGSWSQFTTEDGLIWNDCDGEAFWADPDGGVWIGTSGGLSHFRPPSGKPLVPVADPIVTSLEIRKDPRMVRGSFSSLSYKYEEMVRFAYRLDDGPWMETQERSISFAGLGPGTHNLEVRSRIRDGPYSPKLASTKFYLEPLWWESWWFRGVALLLGGTLVSGGMLWRQWLLQRRNMVLERAVRERTAELEAERTKVLEEKQRADAASEAKGQFLAHMSHEIRTPLNGLLGFSSLLEETQDREEAREFIRLIQSSGQTLKRVIDDILDFSKVEAGKLELEIAPFRLHDALEEAAGLFRATAAQKGLHLGLLLAPDLPLSIAGDETRLRQVVLNLISNALKFTESGEIVLSAAVKARDETSYAIGIEVRDTGIGIAPDRMARLFSSFSQADSSISRRYGGTGLGLAISRRLVELMGGAIEAESQPGAGTVFRFTFRAGRAAVPAVASAPASKMATQYLRKLRVLLAEDHKVNQKLALTMLAKLGISADLAEDGAQAVQAVMRNSYDLVLMDVEMPDVDGLAATREIRARLEGRPQPVICGLSAHATAGMQELCLIEGMDRYLTKPIDFQKLRDLLAELAAGTVAANEAAAPPRDPLAG
jgi:signal transduction histidine kinase/CheY-like chemotaxis protein/ligand-binding sensor domain-containing protein